MELDSTRVAVERTIETDVCIIGAGPAGLTLAAELARAGRDVVLLESALSRDDATAQALNDGNVEGDPYAGLQATRHRGVGGTTANWNTQTSGGAGAKYVPLDPCDLASRWEEAPGGWPFTWEELLPWYARAQCLCGLGAFEYEGAAWEGGRDVPLPLAGASVVTRVYQIGARDALVMPLADAVRRSPNARLVTGATAVQLAPRATGATATVAMRDGARSTIHARRIVLAAGAVENARLLLGCAASGGIDDRSGWLGRGFMEHPRDRAISLTPDSDDAFRTLAFFDRHASAAGQVIAGRLAVSADVLTAGGLPNVSATLLARLRPARARLRALLTPLRALGSGAALRQWLPDEGHGWSQHPSPRRVYDGFTVLLNLEQPPRRENAITLGARRDRHGVPLPVLRWRWLPDDQARLERLRAIVARALREMEAGDVAVAEGGAPDPNAHHHAGTTRMHADPMHGVVDADGRVHGTDSLFVAGASTFPTAGFANPTLTIVALSLRLAARLRDEH